MKELFHYLFAEQELGYTLLGDKPMSFCILPTARLHVATREHLFKIYLQGSRSFAKGIEAWNRLATEGFHARYELVLHGEDTKNPSFVIFIHKKAFVEEFNKNLDHFRKRYGIGVTAMSFLDDLTSKRLSLQQLFQDHLSLGILLGYGRHNAELFQKRMELSLEVKIPLAPSAPSIAKKLECLDQHLQSLTSQNIWLLSVTPVNFAADPDHPETIFLKRRYRDAHAKLTVLFRHNDWLDRVFLLMGLEKDLH